MGDPTKQPKKKRLRSPRLRSLRPRNPRPKKPPNLPRRRPPPSPRRLPQRRLLPSLPKKAKTPKKAAKPAKKPAAKKAPAKKAAAKPKKLPQRRPRSKCFIWLTTSNDHFNLIVGKPALFRATNFPIKNFENAIRNIKIVNRYYMILFLSHLLKFL